MFVRASGLRIGLGRFSRPGRGVGVLAMPDARLDTTRHVESVCELHTDASALGLHIPGMADGVIIDRGCVADVVTVTR